jgi:hypothetical protein
MAQRHRQLLRGYLLQRVVLLRVSSDGLDDEAGDKHALTLATQLILRPSPAPIGTGLHPWRSTVRIWATQTPIPVP